MLSNINITNLFSSISNFPVMDGADGRELPEQKFTLNILPMNNIAPEVKKVGTSLTVTQGGTIPLGSNALTIRDMDTPHKDLTVTLDEAPRAGHVVKRHQNMKVQLRAGW